MNGFDTVIVDVLSEEAAEKMGRKVGPYITIMSNAPFNDLTELYPFECKRSACCCISSQQH